MDAKRYVLSNGKAWVARYFAYGSCTLREQLDSFFQISTRNSTFRTEVAGGFANFVGTVYIIFLNPQIFSPASKSSGISPDSILSMTALTAGALTLLGMGLYAKYPLVIAPGLGLNVFLAAGLIKGLNIPWQAALGIVFWEGVLGTVVVLLAKKKTESWDGCHMT